MKRGVKLFKRNCVMFQVIKNKKLIIYEVDASIIFFLEKILHP